MLVGVFEIVGEKVGETVGVKVGTGVGVVGRGVKVRTVTMIVVRIRALAREDKTKLKTERGS